MGRRWTPVLGAVGLVLAGSGLMAQQSPSYKLEEHAFNAGGTPGSAGVVSSASFKLRPGSLGDGVYGASVSSVGYRMDAGFSSAYPPVGEVGGLRFAAGHTDLKWDGGSAATTYRLYRDPLASLAGLAYGACLQGDVATNAATDLEDPPVGGGFFYLVTGVNRLREEGTKGTASSGTERANAAPCP